MIASAALLALFLTAQAYATGYSSSVNSASPSGVSSSAGPASSNGPTNSADGCSRSYTVKDHDVCDDISANNSISTFQLSYNNPKIDAQCHNLQVGDVLCIAKPNLDCNKIYKVVADDSIESIATANKIDTATILANNQQLYSNSSNLYVGQILCVLPTAVGYTPSSNKPAATVIPSTASSAFPQSSVSTSSQSGANTSGVLNHPSQSISSPSVVFSTSTTVVPPSGDYSPVSPSATGSPSSSAPANPTQANPSTGYNPAQGPGGGSTSSSDGPAVTPTSSADPSESDLPYCE